jgi:Mrp family chromosome partitioning ATPase
MSQTSTEEKQRQIEKSDLLIREAVSNIKHRIVVFSGKGGVGKITVDESRIWITAFRESNWTS